MDLPTIAFWALATWAVFSRGNLYVALPWIVLPFGATAVVSPALTFGSSVVPTTAAMVLFFCKVSADRRNRITMFECATQLRAFGLFSIFTVYTLISAFFLPRILEGQVQVLGLRQLSDDLYPLAPITGNLTQSVYVLLSFLFSVALVSYLRGGDTDERFQVLFRGMYAGGAILATTGLIDWLGGHALLSSFRTASYWVYGYTEVAGFGRITGAFAEASGFGSVAAFESIFLMLALPAVRPGALKQFAAPLLIVTLIFLAVASTSTTAYAGLLMFILCLGALGIRNLATGQMRGALPALAIVGLCFTLLSAGLIWAPKNIAVSEELADMVVRGKADSDSYRQRTYWNKTAVDAFVQSGGLGVGPGSQRASSWPIVVLSNLGVPGALSMGLFLILSLLRSASYRFSHVESLQFAAKIGIITAVTMSTLAGTVLDPGIILATLVAILLATSVWRSSPYVAASENPPGSSQPLHELIERRS